MSGEMDVKTLAGLLNLLSAARGCTRAQAGTVYLQESDGLKFLVTQNDELARSVGDIRGDAPFRPRQRRAGQQVGGARVADRPRELVILRHEELQAIRFLQVDGTRLGACAATGGAEQVEQSRQGLDVHLARHRRSPR